MKHLLFTSLLLASLPALAQPTLTGANSNPVPGDVHHYNTSNISAPGSAGANVTWDFSGASSTTGPDANYVACASLPNCSTFPGSTLAIDQGSGVAAFFIADANRFAMNGVSTGSQDIIYSNAEDFTRFPFTYNNSYSDSFAAIITSPGGTISRGGNVTVTADGYGTLLLPWGTVTDVLRIHRHEVYEDIYMGFPIFSYISDIYAWYKPGQRAYLANLSSLEVIGTGITTSSSFLAQTTGIDEIKNIEASLNFFPNPATDVLNVQFIMESQAELEITLMDMLGRKILVSNKSFAKGKHQETINTSTLAKGIYMLKIQGENSAISRKVQIQ